MASDSDSDLISGSPVERTTGNFENSDEQCDGVRGRSLRPTSSRSGSAARGLSGRAIERASLPVVVWSGTADSSATLASTSHRFVLVLHGFAAGHGASPLLCFRPDDRDGWSRGARSAE
jgi:hypothetical protein